MPESSSSDETPLARARLRFTSLHGRGGFTLIELLAAIAIVAVLSAIVFSGGGRASEAGRVAKAKADLVVIGSALEAYVREQGDYPQTGAAGLVQALAGKRDPRGREFRGRNHIVDSGLSLEGGGAGDTDARLVDPWGNAYCYYYKTGAAGEWRVTGFVLYSCGPDGAHAQPDVRTGLSELTAVANVDNVYAAQ